MILFLDFDGVLHPDEVYLTHKGPELRGPGYLFMWSDLLEKALAPHPEVKIVLSTSWVRLRSYSRTRKSLPPLLRERVIGATWHSRADPREWMELTRYQQIRHYLSRAGFPEWVAIDDDDEGWGSSDRSRLILTLPDTGISSEAIQDELALKLIH